MILNLLRTQQRKAWWLGLLLGSIVSVGHAAEFVIAPNGDKVPAPGKSASSMRDKARTQRGDTGPVVPLTTIIQGLEEESPFGARPDGATTDNRNRARSYQQGGDGSNPSDLDRLLTDPDSNRGKVKSNLDRARAYQKGGAPGVTNPNMGGTDNLPIVDCNAADSVAARIGDDYASGSVIILMRDGKGIKVRCK